MIDVLNRAEFTESSLASNLANFAHDAELIEQWGFIPGLKELIVTRQVHALEHATVWILSDLVNSGSTRVAGSSSSLDIDSYIAPNTPLDDNETIGGVSTAQGFYLSGDIEPFKLRRAVNLALIRLQQGETNLALHPRCGTNSSVATILTAGMAMVSHLTLPKDPVHQLMGLGAAAMAASYLAPGVGTYVQKYITTAIPFNLKLKKITKITDKAGNSGYFVRLNWVDA